MYQLDQTFLTPLNRHRKSRYITRHTEYIDFYIPMHCHRYSKLSEGLRPLLE